MALFDENVTITPAPRRRRSRRTTIGLWSLVVALVVLLIISFLPSSYVIQRPGPVFNTLGTAQGSDGGQVPLISISGAATYPTKGALDLLTVQVVGSPERTPSWFELAMAWFDPSRAVLPIGSVFSSAQTAEERNQESSAMMVDSQKEATAAALTHLGYDVGQKITIYSLTPGSAAAGILAVGDVIVSADGTTIASATQLRETIAASAGTPVSW